MPSTDPTLTDLSDEIPQVRWYSCQVPMAPWTIAGAQIVRPDRSHRKANGRHVTAAEISRGVVETDSPFAG